MHRQTWHGYSWVTGMIVGSFFKKLNNQKMDVSADESVKMADIKLSAGRPESAKSVTKCRGRGKELVCSTMPRKRQGAGLFNHAEEEARSWSVQPCRGRGKELVCSTKPRKRQGAGLFNHAENSTTRRGIKGREAAK